LGIALDVLRDEGVPESQIAQALSERGGIQGICRGRARAKKQALSTGKAPTKLFKRPPAALPRILQDAIVLTDEDGHDRIEDGNQRAVLFLAVPKPLLSRIRPGELHICAVVGGNDT